MSEVSFLSVLTHRTSLSYVEIRELLGALLGCGINGCTGLAYNDILCGIGALLESICNEELAFRRCGTVTDGNDIDIILLDEIENDLLGLCDSLVRLCGVNNGSIENHTCLIYNSKLTACSVAGVVTENGLTLDGSLHEKVFEVFGEELDCALACIT